MLLQITLSDDKRSKTVSGIRISSNSIKVKYVAEETAGFDNSELYQTFTSYTIVESVNQVNFISDGCSRASKVV